MSHITQSKQNANMDTEPMAMDIPPDLYYGEVLKRARVHYGLTIHDVEKSLRIRASYLLALEEGNTDMLPGRVYAIGFVRSYAEFLGLNGDRMIYLFKTQAGNKTHKPKLYFPAPASESKLPGIIIVLVSICALIAVLYISYKAEPKPPEEPSVSIFTELNEMSQTPTEPVISQVLSEEQLKLQTYGPFLSDVTQQKSDIVVMKITESAWVEIIKPDGEKLVSKVLRPGEEFEIPNKEGYIVNTGNLGGVVLSLNNKELPSLGKTGQVGRNIQINYNPVDIFSPGIQEQTTEDAQLPSSEEPASVDRAEPVQPERRVQPAQEKSIQFPYSGTPYRRR